MKTSNKNKAFTLTHTRAAVLIITALIAITLIFTGCPNNAGGSPTLPAPTPKYTVTFNVADGNGTLKATVDGSEISSGNNVERGKSVTFTAKPDDGWQVAGWTGVTATPPNSTIVTLSNVTGAANVTVKFKFADKTYTVDGVSFTMRIIDTVTDKTVGRRNKQNNKPHTVSLSAYRIGETEVTQELWQAVMGTNPSHFQGAGKEPASGEVQKKRPVESVSWYDCIAFCNELTKKVNGGSDSECVYTVDGHTYGTTDTAAKKEPVMDMTKKGFRLPTETEWEWAAMGGTEDQWAGTDEGDKVGEYAWYDENSENKTHEVKKKLPNGYGLYDMSGNVWEWCWDWYSSTTPAGGQDPAGGASGSARVLRSGSLIVYAEIIARAHRGFNDPGNRNGNRGLRLACRP